MEEFGFVEITSHEKKDYFEQVSAMRIVGSGCIVRSLSVVTSQNGLVSSQSICFVPGVKIKEITDEQENVIARKLVSDTRKF